MRYIDYEPAQNLKTVFCALKRYCLCMYDHSDSNILELF